MSAHLSEEQREAAATGDASFAAHLETCTSCRTAVRDAKGRQRLLRGVVPYTLNDMAFRRVEARLVEQAELGLPSAWPRWLVVALPLAATAAVAFVVARGSPELPTVVASPPPTIAARALPVVQATFASADLRVRVGDGEWAALSVPSEVKPGSSVSGSRVTLAGANGFGVDGSGSFSVGGDAMIVLGAGAITSVGGAEVLAGPRRVLAEVDSAFRVQRTAAEVVLDVAQGTVTVLDEGTARRRSIVGPVRVRWADGTPLEGGATEPLVDFAAPKPVSQPVSAIDLSGLPAGTLIDIDDLSLGALPFSLALETGHHRLRWTSPGKPTQERFIDLVGGQPFVFALAPEVAVEHSPEPDAEALARVLADLKRQTPRLRACYEKWLKANPSASGTVDLVLVVSARGAVKRAEVKGDPISPKSVTCLKTTAKSLVLSPLGSEQELEVPLVLTPGRR